METLIHSPAAPLASLVDVIWLSQSAEFNYRNVTLPLLQQELLINVSDEFEVSGPDGIQVSNAQSWVSGLQTAPILTRTGGRHFVIGILFKPWGLQAITGIDAHEFKNRSVLLEDVLGAAGKQLQEQLLNSSDPQETFSILTRFLLERWKQRALPAYLQYSLQALQELNIGEDVVKTVAGECGITSKTLIQRFRRHIGISPAKYHHLAVLHQTLQYLHAHPGQALTTSGYALQFFDQAHFIHFFKQYTGFTPKAYLRLVQQGQIQAESPYSITL